MRGIAVAVLLLSVARGAGAHPIHTTLTVLTADKSGSVTVSIRVFADDFAVAVARAAGRKVPGDSSVVESDVTAYVRNRVTLLRGDGAAVKLEPCGVRRAGEVYLLCFTTTFARTDAIRLRNELLTELHDDQVNVVQLKVSRESKSYLQTKGSAPAVLRR
jgi:hypothetical protein